MSGEADKAALAYLADGWCAGPELPTRVVSQVGKLVERGLVDRRFDDCGEPEKTVRPDGVSYRMSACWWFKTSDAGRKLLTPEPTQ